MINRRIKYFLLFLFVLFIEALIALFARDKFIRPYVGDILSVICIYFFIRIFIPRGVRLMPLYIFLFAAAVEAMQYFGIAELPWFENCLFLRVLIGSVFDLKDILCYAVGCLFIAVLGILSKKCKFNIGRDIQ